ncbi:hypothetical protein CKW39_03530 [Kocuria sp. WRN011]|nr:hypothetical protein CKW39_03530 [Kocuria sp. WRN011]
MHGCREPAGYRVVRRENPGYGVAWHKNPGYRVVWRKNRGVRGRAVQESRGTGERQRVGRHG